MPQRDPSTTAEHSTGDARVRRIRAALLAHFAPETLEVIDQSDEHAGHLGARSGKGHFAVRIVAASFAHQTPLQRHRAVYSALAELMHSDIHALSIDARPPDA